MSRQLGVFIAKRLLIIPLSMLVVITLAFGLVSLMPGDPALIILGSFATDAEIARVHAELGLDLPLWQRYLDYLSQVVQGDLGTSFVSRRPVLSEIAQHLPDTIELVVPALAVAFLLGLGIGTVAAYYRRQTADRVARSVITAFQSIPDFVLGLFLIYLLFFLAGLVPSPVGRLGLLESQPPPITHFLFVDLLLRGEWGLWWSAFRHAIVPILTLGVVYSAYFAKTARSTMNVSLRSPQVEFARACGLPERKVIRYAFLTARTPMLTYGAVLLGALVGGAAIIEVIFSWQGLGQWALESILDRDVPAIQGFIIVAGLMTLVIYLVLDVLTVILDPRVEIG